MSVASRSSVEGLRARAFSRVVRSATGATVDIYERAMCFRFWRTERSRVRIRARRSSFGSTSKCECDGSMTRAVVTRATSATDVVRSVVRWTSTTSHYVCRCRTRRRSTLIVVRFARAPSRTSFGRSMDVHDVALRLSMSYATPIDADGRARPRPAAGSRRGVS